LNYRKLIQAPFEVTQIAYVTREIKSSAARFTARAGIESCLYIQSLLLGDDSRTIRISVGLRFPWRIEDDRAHRTAQR